MPKATSFNDQPPPFANGPCVQAQVPAALLNVPGTLAAGATWTSDLISSDGYQKISAALTSSQAGSLAVLRFLDDAGTIAQTAFAPTAVSAATAAVNNVNDGLPFASFQITFHNTSGSTATLTNVMALLQSQ